MRRTTGETTDEQGTIRLVCLECGRIEEYGDVHLEQIMQDVMQPIGYQIRTARVEARGRCAACQPAGTHPPTIN